MSFLDSYGNALAHGFDKVGKSARREVERALEERVTHIEEDFDGIATAIDRRGLVGGVVEAVDVFSPGHQIANELDAWNVIPEDPALKELVSAGANLWTTGPFSLVALKDIADAIGAAQGSPRASAAPSQSAPPPPRTSCVDANGYADPAGRHVDVRATQSARLQELGDVLAALRGMREARDRFRAENPGAPVPTDGHYTIDEILNHPSMSTGEVCCRVVAVIIHEHPEALDTVGACTGTPPPPPPASENTPEARAPGSNTEAGRAVFGMFGQIASFLGPVLGNPLVGTALSALLMATPLAPIAPFLPVILPIAGSALTMLGGAASQVANGQEPTLDLAQGPTPDMLGQLLQAVPAMLGGAPASPVGLPAAA